MIAVFYKPWRESAISCVKLTRPPCDAFASSYTAFDESTTPPTLIRRDWPLGDLRKQGWKLPPMYFDEIGNIRGANDELIFEGPQSVGK